MVALLMLAGQVSIAKADELSDLKQQMADQAKLLKQMQQQLERLEAAQKTQDQQVDAKITKAVEARQIESVPDSMKWTENIKWSGDFRYRHETIDDESKTTQRDRNRIRARLKMEAKVNDEWDAIFRIATGSTDSPTSTNHTLGDSAGDGFSSRQLWLDWAYAKYHPDAIPGLDIMAGKMGNPFFRVAKHQLMVDGDVSPEGGAAIYGWDLDNSTKATVTAGGYWVREREADADTSLFGVQGYLKHNFNDDSHLLAGASYYDFGNIQGQQLGGIDPKGNSTTNGAYDSDFDLFEAFGEYGFKVCSTPVAVYGTYIKNVDCFNDEDTAWMLGCKLNKAKAPGTWEASYNYRDIEANAVVGGLNDSDFIGGGTDGRGHVLGFKYQLAKNVQGALKYFISEKNVSTTKDDFKMLQADVIVKF